jgi:AAA ATPase-like protein
MVGTSGFVGRTTEREILDGLLARVRDGESEALVIRGEAGLGKTALLRYTARQASGFRVAQLTGVEAEMELPFAGIHQLCTTLPDRIEGLPAPQRNALGVALGLAVGEAPERFLVGLAVLSLLSAVAAERPLLCLVEDGQWLDAASAQIIGLVARRVLGESVAIVLAVREPAAENYFDGLPELRLDGLAEQDARALLQSVVAGRLETRVADRIVAETRGNPLALLELPARMTAAELAGGFELPATGELPTQIEDHYLRRVRELPEATQLLMLVAAAEPLGDPALLLRAGRQLDIATSALAPAEAEELLEIGTRVQFRHPLVRSAIYRAAPSRHRGRTRRSPASSSGRPAEHRLVVGSPRRRPSSSAPPRSPRTGPGAVGVRSGPLSPVSSPARSQRLGACWPQRRPRRSTSSSARKSTCCARSWRSSPAEAPTRRRSCWPRPTGSKCSTSPSRARHTWTRSPRRCSVPGSTAAST